MRCTMHNCRNDEMFSATYHHVEQVELPFSVSVVPHSFRQTHKTVSHQNSYQKNSVSVAHRFDKSYGSFEAREMLS